MKFAFIVTGSIFHQSYCVSNNVKQFALVQNNLESKLFSIYRRTRHSLDFQKKFYMAGKFRFRWPSWWAVIWQISIIENLAKMKIPSQINPPLSFIGFYIILFINILDEHEGNIFFIKGQICLKVNFYQTILFSCSFESNFNLPIRLVPLWKKIMFLPI